MHKPDAEGSTPFTFPRQGTSGGMVTLNPTSGTTTTSP